MLRWVYRVACLGFCLIATTSCDEGTSTKFLDYGRTFYFASESGGNRVQLAIESRAIVGEGDAQAEYLLLRSHPREFTFLDNGRIYSDMIIDSDGGASFVTFIMQRDGSDALILRRYEKPDQPPEALRQCVSHLWGASLPPALYEGRLVPTTDMAGIERALTAGSNIFARAHYEVEGTPVTLEFPVPVLNISPDRQAPEGKQWQAAATVPLFLPSEGDCHNFFEAFVAFGRLDGDLEFVYLCPGREDPSKQDFSCTINIPGRVEMVAAE